MENRIEPLNMVGTRDQNTSLVWSKSMEAAWRWDNSFDFYWVHFVAEIFEMQTHLMWQNFLCVVTW